MTNTRRILVQVTLPFTVIGILCLFFSILGIWGINRMQANRARLLSTNVRRLQATREMEIRLRQFRFHSVMMLVDPSPKRQRFVINDRKQFEQAFSAAAELTELPGERKLLHEIADGFQRYSRELELAQRTSQWGSLKDLLRWTDAHPVETLMKPCEVLLRLNGEAMHAAAEESQSLGRQGRLLFLLMGVFGPVGGLLSGFGAAWGLSRSITRLRIRLQDASAHLDKDSESVSLTGEGVSDQLERQVDHVVAKIKDVVARSQQQQRDLIRAEQLAAIGQLAASIAHEVRNPLTGINLVVGAALHRHSTTPLTREDLEFIHAEIKRLERKVQALLDFARPSEPSRERCDLAEQVRQAVHLVDGRVHQIGVRVEVQFPDEPVWVYVDRDQFASVLVNLFINALDAMPRGGTLSVSLEAPAEGEIRLTVSDTGPGIDPAVAERLFTPFASTKKTGTGLGLSISRRIVTDHGGTLAGSNRAEGGACFTIRLPVQLREAAHGESTNR